jgi:hypothetical protein
MSERMSDTTIAARDTKTGRFLTGHKRPGPGRPRGSRAKLSEQFVSDLADAWQKHGIEALERCAQEEPATFVRTIANLLPRDIRIDATIDVTAFAARFDAACEMLGNRPRSKLIEHDDGG